MRSNNVEFELVEVSKLSMNDMVMHHEPKSGNELHFKDAIMWAIQNGIKDFWWPRDADSFNTSELAKLVADKNPGMDFYEWIQKRNCLAALIMEKAIELGGSIEDVWKAVFCGTFVSIYGSGLEPLLNISLQLSKMMVSMVSG